MKKKERRRRPIFFPSLLLFLGEGAPRTVGLDHLGVVVVGPAVGNLGVAQEALGLAHGRQRAVVALLSRFERQKKREKWRLRSLVFFLRTRKTVRVTSARITTQIRFFRFLVHPGFALPQLFFIGKRLTPSLPRQAGSFVASGETDLQKKKKSERKNCNYYVQGTLAGKVVVGMEILGQLGAGEHEGLRPVKLIWSGKHVGFRNRPLRQTPTHQ